MTIFKIRRNDEVVVLTGKDKGKKGVVKFICCSKKKVVVSGINLVKKHQKPIPDKNQPGGIIIKETPIDLSNVAIFNPVLKRSDRIGFKMKNGRKVRVFKSNGNIIG